jgi:hypothetical protein
MKKKYASIPVVLSLRTTILTSLGFFFGLLPFIPILEDALQVPLVTQELVYLAKEDQKLTGKNHTIG